MGVIQSYLRALVHGPWHYVGLNITNLHMEKVITQVLTALKYGTLLSDMAGILLRASMEDMKQEMGLHGDLFTMPLEVQHLVTESWIKNVWLSCQRYEIQIQMPENELAPPCINNIEINCLFLQNRYCTKELRVLNQCHMYLHAFWLLDLCNGSGTEIHDSAWTSEGICDSPWCWPVSAQPSAGEW